jgi:hypothetical protein
MKIAIVSVLLAGGLLLGYQSGARALGFPAVPPILPDICASVMGCDVTFTDSAVLMQAQQYLAMVQNFRNVGNLAGAQGSIQQAVGIFHAAAAAPPIEAGNTAAEQVITAEPDTETRVASIDTEAQAADGIQQQAQVTNLYQSTIAGEVNKTNALLAEQQEQKKAQDDDAVATYLAEFGPNTQAGTGSDL